MISRYNRKSKYKKNNISVIKMTDTTKMITDLLKKREQMKKKKPAFYRTDALTVKRLGKKWRLPRGRDNKMRRRRKASLPGPSYSAPKAVRTMHPRGLFEVLVSCEKDLENLDAKKQIIRIRGTVGNRKKRVLIKKATELRLEILNPRIDLMLKAKEDKKKETKTKETAKKEEPKTVQEPKDTKDTKEKPAAEQTTGSTEKEETKHEEKHDQHKTETKKPPVDKKTAKPTKFEATNQRTRKNRDN